MIFVMLMLNFISFADDATILSTHKNTQLLYSHVNRELVNLHNFFFLNKLIFNVDKTNYLLFSNKKAT